MARALAPNKALQPTMPALRVSDAAERQRYVYVRATWRLRDKGRLLWRTAACEGRMR